MQAVAPSVGITQDIAKRVKRWRTFQVIFACTYLGVVLDIITTEMGFQRVGARYEQNPLGSLLIGDLGWVGLFLLGTAIAAVCFFSVRVVCFRLPTRWSAILNALLAVAGVVRWAAVVTAVAYLIETSK